MNIRRTSVVGVLAVLLLAGALRGLWLTADPATGAATHVGVVWHDEGAWVHNARNQALWGVWRTDEWNPMFLAPVFTGLEAAAFKVFGVGTWQARTVPVTSGLIAVLALMWGLWAIAGRRAALIGGVLLATNYTFVMWNRAALMESTMTMFIVVGWAAYARARKQPRWGLLAGVAVVLAFFTKAAAAFFVGAVVVELAMVWVLGPRSRVQRSEATVPNPERWTLDTGQVCVLLGLALAGAVALALFVIPYWAEFQFYNWVMTVERKPTYSLGAFMDRASWLPLTHGVFTRMWFVVLLAGAAAAGVVARSRDAHPAERLAVLWLLVGLVELVVHDSGNERRYVMFVPALIALASLRLAGGSEDAIGGPEGPPSTIRVATVLIVVVMAYLIFGSALRLVWLDEVLANHYATTVRVSAALAVALAIAVGWKWRAWSTHMAPVRLPFAAVVAVVVLSSGIDLTLFARWAGERTFLNYEASRALGTLVPSRTLVHGKLANGLALENQIAPLFVGRGFGNYEDRLDRSDARYILTYTQPVLGQEGLVILDVLEHYPDQRVIAEFNVTAFKIDTTAGTNRAALIDKFPDGPESRARYQ